MTAIIGHRGARDIWPENSLTGFRGAAELGCDAIEFDVHLTDAGELVVIHDPTLERTTEGRGELRAADGATFLLTYVRRTTGSAPTVDVGKFMERYFSMPSGARASGCTATWLARTTPTTTSASRS